MRCMLQRVTSRVVTPLHSPSFHGPSPSTHHSSRDSSPSPAVPNPPYHLLPSVGGAPFSRRRRHCLRGITYTASGPRQSLDAAHECWTNRHQPSGRPVVRKLLYPGAGRFPRTLRRFSWTRSAARPRLSTTQCTSSLGQCTYYVCSGCVGICMGCFKLSAKLSLRYGL